MGKWAGGVLTRAGRELQAKVEAGHTSLDITKIKLGDGMETMNDVDELVDLVASKVTLGVSTAEVKGQTATITGIVSTSKVEIGFWCREWGLFANDPDIGEILYMITIDEMPEWLPPSTESVQISATYAMNVAVANATSIIAQVDLTGLVDVDMLKEHTHTYLRETKYTAGDVLNAPTLPHGLVLECQSEGETDEIIPDVSRMACGDTKLDGTVLWQAKRPMLAPNGAYYYKPEWIYEAIGRLAAFGQSVKKTAAKIVTDDGETFYIGGAAMDVDIDEILIPSDRYAGTVFLYYKKEQPLASGFAWIKNDEIDGEIVNARPTILIDDGSRITATKGKIVRSDNVFYYVDTISREPITTSGAYSYEIATEEDIDEIIDKLGGEQDG